MHVRLLKVLHLRRQRRHERRNLLALQKIDEACQHTLDFTGRGAAEEARHRVDDDHPGPEVLNQLVHLHEMHLETMRRKPCPVILEQTRL
jgi:hypothetical protein